MSLTFRGLASGAGWRATDVSCTFGPEDRPFEEQHSAVCVAIVTQGTFQYRSPQGRGFVSPGALVLGNLAAPFECSHDHGVGDRCLAFHFDAAFLEAIASSVPGATGTFSLAALPPLVELLPLLSAAEAARELGDSAGLEEVAVELAGAVMTELASRKAPPRSAGWDAERRISASVRRLEAVPHAPHPLVELARDAAMSPYHFLRVFRRVVGVTPHQYVLRLRLHHAALRLRLADESISTIAFAAGFNDLSTFNHQFRRAMGVTPSAFRASGPRP